MFYSHTYLARKSPLGTVWIAAHLQHKLRKNHISVTDIPSTVDYIILSDVPIALRLSAHLLLGVVRIYSKKVDYLFHDCNDILTRIRTLFATTKEINLPEDATCAPFYSITLPETFELDALDLDDISYNERVLDKHLTNPEEITITDQIPGENDPYVTFFINEDMRMGVSLPGEMPDTGFKPMDGDVPVNQVNSDADISDYVPVGQTEEFNLNDFGDCPPEGHPETEIMRAVNGFVERSPETLPEIETMRDAVNDSGQDVFEELLGSGFDTMEKQGPAVQTMNEKRNLSPVMEDLPEFGLPSQPNENLPSFGSLPNMLENTSASPAFGFGIMSLGELAIPPTPTAEKQKPNPRKRKQFFDTEVVLSNKSMRKQLNNASDLVCKRKKLPCTALGAWKYNKRSRMDQIFVESSISGLCEDLQNGFNKEFSKVLDVPVEDTHPDQGDTVPVEDTHLEGGTVPVEDTHLEGSGTVPVVDTSLEASGTVPVVDTHLDTSGTVPIEDSHPGTRGPNSSISMSEYDQEIEHARFGDYTDYGSSLPDMSSPSRGDDFTPFTSSNKNSEPPTGSSLDTEPVTTIDRTTSTEPINSDMDTPMTTFDLGSGIGGNRLSDIPELASSAEEGLVFLDTDNTPSEGYTKDEEHRLSERTRAVAQYLKEQSPTSEASKSPSGKLSLNKILEGKTRRKCARMFFETLALKDHGYIDVQQEEAYGDITLILEPLSKAKF